jgi:predicted acetyltransferase
MYRWAKDKDKQAVMALWAKDFESYEPYYSWYFSAVYRPELTLCDFAGPRLAAMLQLSPYTLSLRGAALPAAYLVGVISEPDFRRQGRGQSLLREAHSRMERAGYAAALLYTDIAGFYAPLGYRHCYTRQQLSLPAAPAPPFTAQDSSPAAWRAGALAEDIAELAAIYESMSARYEGYIRRSPADWQKYLGEHSCDKARLALHTGRAYLLYRLEKENLHIIELGFADATALTGALAEAARLAAAAGAKRLNWPAPPDAPQLAPYIAPACWQARPFVMARLINWRQIAKALACPTAALPLLARLDTATQTRLIFGVPAALEHSAELTSRERELLTELFPPLITWVNEYT